MRWLLAMLAHPDDESMGAGGLIVRHTRNDVMVHLVCATRGEQGWGGKPPGARREDLAKIRTAEMEAAATALALAGVEIWDYPDGEVQACDQTEITQRISQAITTLRPAAVVTWGPDGGYGHPDHIAIGRCTDDAIGRCRRAPGRPFTTLGSTSSSRSSIARRALLTSPDGE